ncbi:hypothetical protein B0H63DRAFT_504807 [Podospora didyma]|uniref:phytol kinase n=1 Tax=Podospora didyma TaxID=330526 RepID=A0AAE0P3X6_9PEZI|nr:hypothetical protein B0H63DRAFT_504807 [Podospora didyma]
MANPTPQSVDPAALAKVNAEAKDITNRAFAAEMAGELAEALSLHGQALTRRLEGGTSNSTESVDAAINYNGLADIYLRLGVMDMAEESLKLALKIRDYIAYGGRELGPPQAAAATRDKLGRVFEARGDFEKAREIRLRGAAMGETLCGNASCSTPGGALLHTRDLKGCSACKSVFYCSPACQKKDWVKRHKPLCKAYIASQTSGRSFKRHINSNEIKQ